MTNHLDLFAFNDFLCELRDLFRVFEISLFSRLKSFHSILLFWFCSELYSENVVLDSLENFSKACHVHINSLLEMICTVHVLNNVTWDNHLIAPWIFNCDLVAFNGLYIYVSSLWEELLFSELFLVPQRLTSFCFLESGRLLAFSLSNSTNGSS